MELVIDGVAIGLKYGICVYGDNDSIIDDNLRK